MTGDTATRVDTPDRDPRPDHSISAVLGVRPFRRLWISQGLSGLADWLAVLAAVVLAVHLADTGYAALNFAVVGVLVARAVPVVLLGPAVTWTAARVSPRWAIAVSCVVRVALVASVPLVGTSAWLYPATALAGLFAGLVPVSTALALPGLVPARRRGTAHRLVTLTGYFAGPTAAVLLAFTAWAVDAAHLVGGLAVVPATVPAAGVACVALFVAAVHAAATTMSRTGQDGPPDGGVFGPLVVGWRFVGRTHLVRGLATGTIAAVAAVAAVASTVPALAAGLGGGTAGAALLVAGLLAGLAVGAQTGRRLLRGLSRRRLFGMVLATAGALFVCVALSQDVVLSVLLLGLAGFGVGVAGACGRTALGLEVDDDVRARTFAFVRSGTVLAVTLAVVVAPALAAAVGRHTVRPADGVALVYDGAAWTILLVGVLVAALGALSLREMDDRRGTPLVADLHHVLSDEAHPLAPATAEALPGYFIAFEGGDGAGKTTQARLLQEWLEQEHGHDVVLTREPGATPLGRHLRELLLRERAASGGAPAPAAGAPTADDDAVTVEDEVGARTETLLFAADRAHHVDCVILPALRRGSIVLTDRFMDSSIAYQGAGRDLDPHDVERISRWASGGLVPDLTVVLDLPEEFTRIRRVADAARTGEDRLESLPDAFHARVRRHFLDLARREPHRYLVLDASESREELQRLIRLRLRDGLPVSARRRAELTERLGAEERDRLRRAEAEAHVRRLDAELRGRGRDELRAREESRAQVKAQVEAELTAASAVTQVLPPVDLDPLDAAPAAVHPAYLDGPTTPGTAGHVPEHYDEVVDDQAGYAEAGYAETGYTGAGYAEAGDDRAHGDGAGYDRSGYAAGYDQAEYAQDGYPQEGYDQDGYPQDGYDQDGYDQDGYDRTGHDRYGYDREGYDREGFDQDGYDRDGYDRYDRPRPDDVQATAVFTPDAPTDDAYRGYTPVTPYGDDGQGAWGASDGDGTTAGPDVVDLSDGHPRTWPERGGRG